MKPRFQALRGTKDILPDEIERWQRLERTTHRVLSRYGFREIRTPILEPTELFARSVGATSDIVGKEMYTLEAGGESICLRPENTASVVRAFVEHALHRGVAAGYPARYYYMGPMFRHERPQRGRQRQFHQIGVELLGAEEPEADAETIEMADALFDELGLGGRTLSLNSVGDPACRPQYRSEILAWLAPRLERLCSDCQRRGRDNPLRVFDCKIPEDRELLAEAPTMLDRLCEPCAAHFASVRAALDAYGVAYRVDPRIVRGLDYYRRTVFEVLSDELGAQNAVLGGGRYDGLVEELGGPALPGLGFSIGMERVVLLLAEQAESAPGGAVDLALVGLGAEGWRGCLALARRLRRSGLSCVAPLVERPLGAQLRRADRLGARFALFVGKDELAAGRFGLKDLSCGTQQDVGEAEVAARVREGR